MAKKFENKEFRASVLTKFDFKCAYCGIDLSGERFHLDHFIPKRRGKYRDETKERGKDTFENYMPSCPQCNASKSDLSIEDFRERVYSRLVMLNKYSGEYRMAKRFGLVVEDNKPIIFHFESYIKD